MWPGLATFCQPETFDCTSGPTPCFSPWTFPAGKRHRQKHPRKRHRRHGRHGRHGRRGRRGRRGRHGRLRKGGEGGGGARPTASRLSVVSELLVPLASLAPLCRPVLPFALPLYRVWLRGVSFLIAQLTRLRLRHCSTTTTTTTCLPCLSVSRRVRPNAYPMPAWRPAQRAMSHEPRVG